MTKIDNERNLYVLISDSLGKDSYQQIHIAGDSFPLDCNIITCSCAEHSRIFRTGIFYKNEEQLERIKDVIIVFDNSYETATKIKLSIRIDCLNQVSIEAKSTEFDKVILGVVIAENTHERKALSDICTWISESDSVNRKWLFNPFYFWYSYLVESMLKRATKMSTHRYPDCFWKEISLYLIKGKRYYIIGNNAALHGESIYDVFIPSIEVWVEEYSELIEREDLYRMEKLLQIWKTGDELQMEHHLSGFLYYHIKYYYILLMMMYLDEIYSSIYGVDFSQKYHKLYKLYATGQKESATEFLVELHRKYRT